MFAAAAAPAIVRADALMRIRPVGETLLTGSEVLRRQGLLRGELGRIDGLRFHGTFGYPIAAQVWAQSLWSKAEGYKTGDVVTHEGEQMLVIVPARNSFFNELLRRSDDARSIP